METVQVKVNRFVYIFSLQTSSLVWKITFPCALVAPTTKFPLTVKIESARRLSNFKKLNSIPEYFHFIRPLPLSWPTHTMPTHTMPTHTMPDIKVDFH